MFVHGWSETPTQLHWSVYSNPYRHRLPSLTTQTDGTRRIVLQPLKAFDMASHGIHNTGERGEYQNGTATTESKFSGMNGHDAVPHNGTVNGNSNGSKDSLTNSASMSSLKARKQAVLNGHPQSNHAINESGSGKHRDAPPAVLQNQNGHRQSASSAAADYWAAYLSDLPSCIFPTINGLAGHNMYSSQGLDIDAARLKAFCQTNRIELLPVLQAAWAVLLHGYTLADEACFGYLENGRSERAQTFVCRVRLSLHETFAGLLESLQAERNAAMKHPHVRSALPGDNKNFDTLVLATETSTGPFDDSLRVLHNEVGLELAPEIAFGLLTWAKYNLVLTFNTSAAGPSISVSYSNALLSLADSQRLARSLEKTINAIIDTPDSPLAAFHIVSSQDIDLGQYANLPPPTASCIHWMIDEQVRQRPEAEAISSWDGSLTYLELGSLVTSLAAKLQHDGVVSGSFVAFCFPKCIPAILTMLAVQKAGAAFVPLDPKAPAARWRGILKSVDVRIALCAPEYANKFEGIVNTVLPIDQQSLREPSELYRFSEPSISPSDPSFLIFTSGSTGVPKGILIEHQTMCSLSDAHFKHLGIGPGSRMFQFCAYTFDAGIMDILLTLSRGGCVCSPSEHDRLNDLCGVMTRLRANWIFITPSVADTLVPSKLPYLKNMGLGGELITPQLASRWKNILDFRGVYGPTEVCVCATNDEVGFAQPPSSLGRPLSSAFWIVDPSNTKRLVPDGCIGELLIQGPLLARGYVSGEDVARRNWVTDPKRLPSGIPGAKAYLTGDLVRRHENGTFEFIGRKDSQVKIRGQRTELGEIETRLSPLLPDNMRCAVLIMPGEDRSLDSLVALLWFTEGPYQTRATVKVLDTVSKEHKALIAHADENLRLHLPPYMIPAVYLIFQGMPEQTHTGKVDRRRLLAIGRATKPAQRQRFAPQVSERMVPTTPIELKLRKLWAHVLRLSAEEIGKNDNFFHLGGDSVSAIRLVSDGQRAGMSLSVASIFEKPSLAAMALAAAANPVGALPEVSPFSLLPRDMARTDAIKEARQLCDLTDSQEVEDIYPCTALQQGLMAIGSKKPGSYVAKYVYRIRNGTGVDHFKASWEETVRACEILRTRIIATGDGSTLQLVVKDDMTWDIIETKNLESAIDSLRTVDMGYGSRLCRFAIVRHQGEFYFIWIIHHALYDGWTVRIVLDTLQQAYDRVGTRPPRRFTTFISYTSQQDSEKNAAYWKEQLAGAKCALFPTPSYRPQSKHAIHAYRTTIGLPALSKSSVTRASLLQAAWAIILARYCDTDDICFGMTVSGRRAPIPLVNDIAGPMIATVPVRVRLDQDCLVSQFLADVQSQSTEMIPYEQFGIQNIAKLDPDAAAACSFSSLLVLQPADLMDIGGQSRGGVLFTGKAEKELSKESVDDYFDYPLVLQVILREETVDLVFLYDSSLLASLQCHAMAQQMGHVAAQLAKQADKMLRDVSVAGDWDLQQAVDWNGPDNSEFHDCLPKVIDQWAEEEPEHEAIYCFDGSMTYGDLVEKSNLLASRLRHLRLPRGSVVSLCFESSKWAVVAMLGVFKAGCAFLSLDITHPEVRKKMLIAKAEAEVIIASSSAAHSCQGLARHIIELSEALFESSLLSEPNGITSERIDVLPSDMAYLISTSGSTGTPKGVIIDHAGLSTSILSFGRKHNMSRSTRLLQFSNYVFDGCIYEIFLALAFGGTSCIPPPSARLGDLPSFMNEAHVSTAIFTPSFLKTLDPARLTTMNKLIVAGEALNMELVNRWKGHVHFINAYGPTETCVCCASRHYPADEVVKSPNTIGTKVHGNCWIVEPENHDRLCPIGCVGELVVEGTALARGYLKDPTKTRSVFLQSVSWMPGRSFRLYKTGDLVKYNADGTLEYVGRKDTQIKLRGQRLELGEVEYGIHAASDLVKNTSVHFTKSRASGDMLIAFVELASSVYHTMKPWVDELSGLGLVPATDSTQECLSEVEERLRSTLPRYMIPSFFIPLSHMPFVSSLKMDRKRLQELADNLSLGILGRYSLNSAVKIEPVTAKEFQIRSLWASILGINAEDIGRHDSFLQMGGDSISAIQVSVMARKQGLDLPVPVIFKDARLSAVAEAAVAVDHSNPASPAAPSPFSLLSTEDVEGTVKQLYNECKLSGSEVVQDAYPCTPLQEGLLALSVKHPGSYIAKFVYRLHKDTDLDRFKEAWERVYNICENQRLRVVKLGSASIQTLVGGDFAWEATDKLTLREFLEVKQTMTMSYGSKLCRSAMIHDPTGERYLVWIIHHAMYDGWNVTLILDALRQAYHGEQIQPFNPYSSFIQYASRLDLSAAGEYWKMQLRDAHPADFPPLTPPSDIPTDHNGKVTRVMTKTVKFSSQVRTAITMGTILRATWAVVLARYGNTDDVVFGATASGRNAPVAGIEKMAGTVIGTVPVRIRVEPNTAMRDFLQEVQAQAMDMMPYEQTGFQNIIKFSPETRRASQVSSLLIVQPERQNQTMSKAAASIMEPASSAEYSIGDALEGYFTFPIVLQCLIYRDHVVLDFTYVSTIVSPQQMEALCHHFDAVVQQLLAQDDTPLGHIKLASDWDVQRAVEFNSHVVEIMEESCLHDLVSRWAKEQPSHEAILTTDMSISYAELEELSTKLSNYLAQLGVSVETVVPICFEKSAWTIVAMLGIMKAGGTFMPLDPSHPASRRQALIKQVNAHYLITSPSVAASCEGMVDNLIQLSAELLRTVSNAEVSHKKSTATDAAYILFTSGSTGFPKGITVEHRAICSSIMSHGREFAFGTSSRVLQFSSYVFDVSMSEILTTLVFGGTVCVPSETERMQEVADFINRSRVNTAMLTPSFVTTFTPEQVPDLKLLILGGEGPTKTSISTWQPHLRLLNGYAPAECCIYALTHEYKSSREVPTVLGKGLHSNCWIVEPDNHNQLAPIGCVGELILQSNAIGRGYVNDERRTKEVFLETIDCVPTALQRAHYRFYKSGDLVKYDASGNIEYLGRKDTQVKLRGQRIELGEIEYNIRKILKEAKHVAVEVVRRNSREALIVFVSFTSTYTGHYTESSESEVPSDLIIPTSEPIKRLFQALVQGLADRLPPYMVPSLFMPLQRMPFLRSMKVDRRKLRSLVDGLSVQAYSKLSLAQGQKQVPSTEQELKLRDLWSEILHVDKEHISADDNFFQAGGDSLAAMQLSTLTRKHGGYLPVFSIFETPVLASMAQIMYRSACDSPVVSPPFENLPEQDVESILHDAQAQGIAATEIEDILPCTSLQEGMLALSMRQPGAYVSSTVYKLAPDTDRERFKTAWQKTVQICSNLRTCFFVPASSTSGKPLQILTKSGWEWDHATGDTLAAYTGRQHLKNMELGSPPCRFALIEGPDNYFVLTMHHAIYDMWSMHLILKTLEDAYHGTALRGIEPYAGFVKYSFAQNTEASKQFWASQLQDATKALYPPPRGLGKTADQAMKVMEATIDLPESKRSSITKATILRAAWAIVLARYCDSKDICFGTTVSGRLAPLAGLASMAGPTISTVPVRLRLDPDQQVVKFLEYVQSHSSSMIAHEQYGLQNIASTSPGAKAACNFSTLLVIHPLEQLLAMRPRGKSIMSDADGHEADNLVHADLQSYFNYPLVMNFLTSGQEVKLHAYYDSSILSDFDLQVLHHHLRRVIDQLYLQPDTPLGSVTLVDKWDMDLALSSQTSHEATRSCTHWLIEERTLEHPTDIAISCSEGDLSYEQLLALCKSLSFQIRSTGLQADSIVPIYLPSSKWAIVAMLAVQLAGGAFMVLDARSSPEDIQMMLSEAEPHLVLSSAAASPMIQAWGFNTLIVPADTTSAEALPPHFDLPETSPENASFVVCTSDTTSKPNTPKTVVVSHSAACSAGMAYSRVLNIGAGTRVFQSSPLSTYIGVLDVLGSISGGGCLCLHSDHDSSESLCTSIRNSHAEVVFLTLTAADTIRPSEVPSLKTVILDSRSINQRLVDRWSGAVQLRGVLGCAEASLYAWNESLGQSETRSNLVKPLSSALWVVEESDPSRPVPMGCVGELLVESPQLARHYLKGDDQSNSPFLDDLIWLPGSKARRVFKTGDLVCRRSDGSFEFIRRKGTTAAACKSATDHQHIELKLQETLPEGMAGIVTMLDGDGHSLDNLTGLIWYTSGPRSRGSVVTVMTEESPDMDETVSRISLSLAIALPRHMIPSSYVFFLGSPSHVSAGVVNRRELITIASTLPFEKRRRAILQKNERAVPQTRTESKLRDLWATVLSIPASQIGRNDSFLQIGGDSISAIQLVTLARRHGLGLNVAAIFKEPRLVDMAASAIVSWGRKSESFEPFSLLPQAFSDYTLDEIRQQCRLRKTDSVEDAYPCTPLQEGLLALGVKQPESYIARYVLRITEGVDVDAFKLAWERTVQMSANLRTRILIIDGRTVQVVIKGAFEWEEVDGSDIKSFMKKTPKSAMGYGSPLSRYVLVAGRYLVWTVHHAVSDGWTTQIILDRLQKAYHRAQTPEIGSFAYFVKHVMNVEQQTARQYWDQELVGAKRAPFPAGVVDAANAMAMVKKTISIQKPSDSASVTLATVLRAAWALIIARYCDSTDVCFGTTVSGRQAAIEGLNSISGPTIATVPVRVRIDLAQSVNDYLQAVQRQAVDMVPYEQFGLQNIAKVNGFAREACEFSSLLAIQPGRFVSGEHDDGNTAVVEFAHDVGHEAQDVTDGYYTYPLVVQLQVGATQIEFDIIYATSLLSEYRVEALTCHFEHVTKQLLTRGDATLDNISVAGAWDLEQCILGNQEDLTPVNACVHDYFASQVAQIPDKEAVYSTDQSLSYAELDVLSSRLAAHLRNIGVRVETIVPFCFEKSIWAVVSIMAILKAGGAFMPLDPTHPFSYRKGLVDQVGAKIIIVSPTTAGQCHHLADIAVEVWPCSPFFQSKVMEAPSVPEPRPGPKNAAYVLFSSGSSGVPKGIVVEHAAFSASLRGHGIRFGFSRDSRVLQFSNYVFDVSVSEVITTLAWGGTICVPTDVERLHGTARFMTESRCDMATMTPSFIRTLTPEQVPTLKKLLAGGEAVTSDILETWADAITLINAYGPAEDSVYSVAHDFASSKEIAATIGRGVTNAVWVVDTDNPGRLAPIGCVGELVLQGPAIGRGYVNDWNKTQESFMSSLDFLPTDVVQQAPRFYKTGDLVQYHEPGQLLFVGRRDAQVKLRGQRIELGDIEYKIKRLRDAIGHAVVDVLSQQSSEVLVAFISFTGEEGDQQGSMFQASTETRRNFFRDLSNKLATVLPRHMVPTYYIPMAFMPQTSSGKIARKLVKERGAALTTDELLCYAVSQRSAFRDPSSEVEIRLRSLWARTLRLEESSISIDDNFYDMGGDSIRIVTLIKLIQKGFGVQLGLSMLNSRSTTISAMAQTIASRTVDIAKTLDLYKDICDISRSTWLAATQAEGFKSMSSLPSHSVVFLTGASGFLGTQLLRQLLIHPNVERVVALVRSVSVSQGIEKLKRTARIAGWWKDGVQEKVEVWTGDLGVSRMGITDAQWQRLCGKSSTGNIDAIVHNGAVVNWNADYNKLKQANVQSTMELLEAVVESPRAPKMVFVSGGTRTDPDVDLAETAKALSDSIGYSQTKFVAEAVLQGLVGRLARGQNRFSTVKPGLIIGTAEEGVANVDDFVWRVVSAAAQLQLYPADSMESWITLNDAGSVAGMILSQLSKDHIDSFVNIDTGLPSSVFWEQVISELPQPCNPVSWDVWSERALEHMNQVGENHPLWPIQHFLGPLGVPRQSNAGTTTDGRDKRLRAAVRKNVRYLLSVRFIPSGEGGLPRLESVLGRS